MFLEKDSHNKSQGWIEVVCGSMFSGKTEELIRRLNRARIAKLRVEIFKPGIDTRYSEEDVVSHNSNALHSIPVENAQQILFYSNECDVIGIDEAQFFGNELIDVCQQLANQGIIINIQQASGEQYNDRYMRPATPLAVAHLSPYIGIVLISSSTSCQSV